MRTQIKVLIIGQASWRKVLSRSFYLYETSNKSCSFLTFQSTSYNDALYRLENENYNIILANDVLESFCEEIPAHEGLYVFDYLKGDSRFKDTLKILIKTNLLMLSENDIKNYQEKYCLDYVYIQKVQPVIKDLIDDIMILYKNRFEENSFENMNEFKNGYALLIGVGYDKSLPATVNDAKALYDLLIDPRLAAYPQEQVQVLTEEASTKDSILSGLDTLADQVRENPDATVWIYFSGHGFLHEETHEYFLIPYEYSLQQIQTTCISSQQWSQKLKAIEAKKLMVWLDCCHAGGMLSKELNRLPFRESPPPKGTFEGLTSGSGRVVVASCKEDQKSYILPGARNSVFTTCLLEVLRGQGLTDSDDEYIRFFQIMSHLYDEVPESVKTKPQNPILVSGEGLDEDFAVCYRPRKKVVISQPTYPAEQIDEIREADVDQSNENVTPAFIENLQNKIKGNYKVLKILNQQIADFEIEEITTANPSLKFELNQKIPGLKERSAALENEIEDLKNRLDQARENFD
jgi:hypothetical protein